MGKVYEDKFKNAEAVNCYKQAVEIYNKHGIVNKQYEKVLNACNNTITTNNRL
jgi:uncharacterized protein YutE (UPF0331/DUF86 family)